MQINPAEIAYKAKKFAKEEVGVSDICFFLLEELTKDKAIAYALSKAKAPVERKAVTSSAYTFASKHALMGKFLTEEIKPVLHDWITEYLRANYDEFEQLIDLLHKDNNPMPAVVSDVINDDVELSDAYFKRVLQNIMISLSNSSLDKDTISSTLQTIKLLRDKFETKNEDDRTIIEIPSPFTGVCSHCNHEI